jgi:tetratricopeptide (TPR) repeat protein
MDRSAALQPLDEVAEPIRRLVEHQSLEELERAVQDVAAAVERSLRLADPSPAALPLEQVVQHLRARDRISIETAGSIHQLVAAAERARSGAVRPGDGDIAGHAVERLRADLSADPGAAAAAAAGAAAGPAAGAPVDRAEPAGPADAPASPASPAGPAGPAGPQRASPRRPPVARGGGRWVAWVGAALALLALIGLARALAGGGDDDFDAGLAAFRAARWDSAAASFERVLENRPVDVTSMLYLSRAYRRQGRVQEAANVLREAARVAPDDAGVRRELGHLFMDLDQPASAVQQFERAVEYDAESAASWAGLVQALRAVGDPRAERVLEEAPPEVRASLGAPRR